MCKLPTRSIGKQHTSKSLKWLVFGHDEPYPGEGTKEDS